MRQTYRVGLVGMRVKKERERQGGEDIIEKEKIKLGPREFLCSRQSAPYPSASIQTLFFMLKDKLSKYLEAPGYSTVRGTLISFPQGRHGCKHNLTLLTPFQGQGGKAQHSGRRRVVGSYRKEKNPCLGQSA